MLKKFFKKDESLVLFFCVVFYALVGSLSFYFKENLLLAFDFGSFSFADHLVFFLCVCGILLFPFVLYPFIKMNKEKPVIFKEVSSCPHLVENLKYYNYISEDYIASLNYVNIFILQIDDYNKIASFYSKGLRTLLVEKVGAEFRAFAKKHGYKAYKFSNDKFLMLNTNTREDKKNITYLAGVLCARFKGYELNYENESVNIACTIGVCQHSHHAINRALLALEIANRRHLDFVIYDDSLGLHKKADKDKKQYKIIEEAMRQDAAMPYYQPIFDSSGCITKYEVLARIISKNGELILPSIFLEYSKKVKRYVELSKNIFRRAFDEIQNDKDVKISINMSVLDMVSNPISAFVLKEIERRKCANNIIIEILESEDLKARDKEAVMAYIAKLRSLGVKIAIDDFGSGFSNFALLLEIVPDFIKIDGSIIQKICEDQKASDMLVAIIGLSKKLGSKTVAEFVSSKEIYERCVELGVDEFQGFYLSKPRAFLSKKSDERVLKH